MAARVLHFGSDECYRVQVLRRAGYEVTETDSLAALESSLQQNEPLDAVVISEDVPRTTEQAAEIVRTRTLTPIILFRRSQRDLDERKFDQVFPWFTSPEEWLAATQQLIAQSQALRENSARLRLESTALRDQFQRERARSLQLIQKPPDPKDHR